jgi:hypothetical protein
LAATNAAKVLGNRRLTPARTSGFVGGESASPRGRGEQAGRPDLLDGYDVVVADIGPVDHVVLEEQRDVFRVSTHKTPPPPAASPLFAEYAVVLLALGIVANGFLQAAGKDLNEQFRKRLVAIMQRAKPLTEVRGGPLLGVRVNRENAYVLFTIWEPISEVEIGACVYGNAGRSQPGAGRRVRRVYC